MTRTELINSFVHARAYRSYLEIGVGARSNFDAVQCEHKLGVDPATWVEGVMHITSDAFFERSMVKFDVIFIDGLHEEHQVDRDIVNSLQHLNPGGIIVLHDCLPPRRMASTSSASFLEGRKLERHSLDECT